MNKITRFVVFLWRHVQSSITEETSAELWAMGIVVGFGLIGAIVGAVIELSVRAVLTGAVVGGYIVPGLIYIIYMAWDKLDNSMLVHIIRAAWQDASTKDKTE